MEPGSVQEQLVVVRCQAGDERAFAQLYDRYADGTLRYLHGLLDERNAEDAHQEVWLTVYRRIRDLTNPARFRTWLFTTARHRAIDMLRKQKREVELLEIAASEFEEVGGDVSGIEAPGPDDATVRTALERLPPAQREVLMLRYWSDMTYAEIALVTGCSIGTVRSRIHHAKRKLHTQLQQTTNQEALQ